MEAPRGVQVSAAAGDFKATCRKELHLQSTEGEVSPSEDTEPLLLREFLPLSSSANPGQARCALCQSFLQESSKLLEYESEKSRVPLSDSAFSTEKKNMDYLNPYIFQNWQISIVTIQITGITATVFIFSFDFKQKKIVILIGISRVNIYIVMFFFLFTFPLKNLLSLIFNPLYIFPLLLALSKHSLPLVVYYLTPI